MVATWRRIAAGAGIALCASLLSGCRAEGSVSILSEESAAVDLMVTGPDVDCQNGVYGLTLSATALTSASGLPACHVFGVSRTADLDQFGIDISTAAEYLVLQTNLSLGLTDLPACDIQIRFPGQVVTTTTGTIVGNAIHITDLRSLAQGSGLRVIAFGRPGPPSWVFAAAIGVGSGAAGILLAVGLFWLARQRRPEVPPLGSGNGPGLAKSSLSADSRGRVGESRLPSPARHDSAALGAELADTAWFAGPPDVPALGLTTSGAASALGRAGSDGDPGTSAAAEPPDRSIWAPPEHRA